MSNRSVLLFVVLPLALYAVVGAQPAHAPPVQGAVTAEQVAIQKAILAKDATIGELLARAARCEGDQLDLDKLKARVAQLETLAKTPAPAAPEKK